MCLYKAHGTCLVAENVVFLQGKANSAATNTVAFRRRKEKLKGRKVLRGKEREKTEGVGAHLPEINF